MDQYKTTKKTDIYSDFFTNFTPHPETKQLLRLTQEDAVKRSVRNIILTNKYERPFSKLGAGIRKLLFENITPQTEASMKELIKTAIENYEPRAKLIDISVTGSADQQAYRISIYFYVINRTEPVQQNITLERIR